MIRERLCLGTLLCLGFAALASAQVLPVQGGRGSSPPTQGPPSGQTPSGQQPAVQRPPLSTDGLILGRVVDAATGRPVAGALVTLGGATPPPVQVPATAPGQRAMSFPPPQRPRFLTDSDGRFAFRYLVRGSYTLTASKPGYADGAHGRTRPNGNMRSIMLADHERVGDISVRLFKNAAIAGTVRDENGDPLVGVQLRLYRRALVAGRRVLQPASNGSDMSTDDRGMYRLRDLVPGEYVVSVPLVRTSMPADFGVNGRPGAAYEQTAFTPGGYGVSFGGGGTPVGTDTRFVLGRGNAGADALNPTTTNGKVLGYASQYFPGATTLARAQVITVASGEERSAVDFVLRPQPLVSISGQLFVPSGDAANYMLHLVPSDSSEMSVDPDMATAVTDNTGAFVFLAIPPGQYVIQTVRVPRPGPMPPPPPPPPPPMPGGASPAMPAIPVPAPMPSMNPDASRQAEPLLWTAVPVSVGETDVRGVAVTMNQGLKISGRVEFEGSAERPNAQRLAQIPVTIEVADGKQRASIGGAPNRISADGRFTSQGQLPGKYFLRIGGAPGGWVLKSAMLNGVDVADTPFDLTDKDISNVVVTFTDKMSSLNGTVRQMSATGDLQDAMVLIFPADMQGWTNFGFNSRRMRSARPSATGSFGIGTLPPGDYYGIAIPDERAAEWQDPKFLETLVRAATRFTIGEGDRHMLELQLQDIRGGDDDDDDDAAADNDDRDRGPSVIENEEAPQVRDPGVPQPVGSATITGRVLTDDGTNQPVRKVRITARAVDARVDRTAFTDDNGKFVLGTLPAGRYYVSMSKSAYLSVTYGQRRPGRGIGTPVVLADAKSTVDLQMRLPKGGVITGTVLDHYGAPLANARVRPMQWTTRDGERVLSSVGSIGSGLTDDRGAYRLYGLQPGTYLIAISPSTAMANSSGAEIRMLSDDELRQATMDLQAPRAQPSLLDRGLTPTVPGTQTTPGMTTPGSVSIPPPPPGPWPEAPPSGRGVGMSTVYYPGTPIDTDGGLVTVALGQEVQGIDVTMRLVPTSRVEGRVMTPDPSLSQRTSVTLMSITGNSTSGTGVRMNPDGSFSATNVAPGKYTLTARLQPPTPPADADGFEYPAPTALFGWQEIAVNGEDLTNVAIAISDGQTISGRVAFAGTTPPPEMKNVRVMIETMGANANRMFVPLPRQPQINADGTFIMKGVMPGRYRLSASLAATTPPIANASGIYIPVAPAWAVKSSSIEGRESWETTFDVQPGQNFQNAIVTFTDQVSEVSGTIVDGAGAPVGGLTILLFPADRAQWQTSSRRMRQAGSQNGKFAWYGLPPGEYFLAVVTELEPSDWGDPAFMDALAAAAMKFTLGEGEKKVQTLRAGG